MASPARLTANIENAQHSTGPRTAEGKAASSRNATKHNLCSVSPVLDTEEKLAFDRLLCEAKLDLSPQTHTEHALIEQAAYAEWKLLRIAAWETEIINATLAKRTAPAQALFGKTPHEALDRLRRYEAATRRAWHNALRELRLAKKLRQDQGFLNDRLRYIANLKQLMEKIIAGETCETNPTPDTGLARHSPQAGGPPANSSTETLPIDPAIA
jgi:hypothetical protein